MCGIAGFLHSPDCGQPEAVDGVRRMSERMAVRGPDGSGLWCGKGIVLGHRRLAILDLDPRSNQPMLSADGRYAMVFNGEIYNFRELRQALEADGAMFRTTSDSEVLLALYAREGQRMLPKLRGMFAFAVWDSEARTLFLARDPYGIKPLYYTQTRQGLVFASQVKALLASGWAGPAPEPAGLAGFYLWGSVPEPWTLHQDILALPAGHCLLARAGVAGTPVCWHDIRAHWRGPPLMNTPDLQEHLRQAVGDSLRAHLVADVPLGVFLSGGIDSATMAGLAAELGANVGGITLGFEEFQGRPDDELPAARTIAAHYGLTHHTRRISRAEFEQDMPRLLDAMDQPSIDGVNTWFASKTAAECGYKAVLSGVGGDELLCGYSSFRQIPQMAAFGRVAKAVPGLRAALRGPCAWLARCRRQAKLLGLPLYMDSLEGVYFLRRSLFLPAELPTLMGREAAAAGLSRLGGTPPGMDMAGASSAVAAVGLLESVHYLRNQLLRDSDWASMAHSLELRTPLVDAQLLAALAPHAAAFAGGVGKTMLARSPTRALPEVIMRLPKTGFGLPMADWLPASATREPWARQWARTVIARMPGCA